MMLLDHGRKLVKYGFKGGYDSSHVWVLQHGTKISVSTHLNLINLNQR